MDRIKISDIYQKKEIETGEKILLKGWVRTNRGSNKFGFLEINDGSFFKSIQVVYESERVANFEEISKISIATAVEVEGEFVLTPQAKQPFEVKACEISVIAESDGDYPLQKKRHSLEYLREIAHLRPRSNTFRAVFRVRSVIAQAIHDFFGKKGFVYVHTPIITGSDAEGAGEMFRVTTLDMNQLPQREDGIVDYSRDFFGKETSLTVSGQLEGEIFALAFGDIYTFGPTFRAENSNTARHASEFWMIEPEMAFCDLQGNMDLAEEMIKHIITAVLEQAPEEMNFFNQFVDKGILQRLKKLAQAQFQRMTYTQAIEHLEKAKEPFQYPVSWGMDLQTEHERYLCEKIVKGPVFVTDYPKDIKAFYMRQNDDGKTVAACDLLVPGVGEIIGGSQREERLDVLKRRMEEMGLNAEDYHWYLELRKYGGVVHSGFGLGFERIIMYVTGMSNIRDVIPFPRTPKSAEF